MADINSKARMQGKWSLEDEFKLLNAINRCGHGNWPSISSEVTPFSPAECEQHFNEKFLVEMERTLTLCSNNCKIEVDTIQDVTFNCCKISEMNDIISLKPANFYSHKHSAQGSYHNRLKANNSSNNNMKFFDYMIALPTIGYNRVRSDFDIEYDNNAENLLTIISENHPENMEMDKDEAEMFQELEFAIFQSYNERLKERNYRKKVVRDHCLLDRRKTYNMLQRLDIGFGRTTLKALIPLLRFLSGPEFDFLVEKLKYQNELRLKRSILIEHRKNGLKYLGDIGIYKTLKNKRMGYNGELACLSMDLDDSKSFSGLINKKPSAPLALGHLPGYNCLNDDEKKLCSSARIVPETFLSFKEVLIEACEKHDGLRLAQARKLIQIDVNKTRKIYDYLIAMNLIWTPD